jgi:cytochrome b involved in lipid metabolism
VSGRDATADYEKALHSDIAHKMLPQYRIGKLKETMTVAEAQTDTDSKSSSSKTCVIC